MSAEDCPFVIIRPEPKDDEEKKDKYASFAIPLDPDNPNGPTSDTKFKKLDSDDPEDILNHIRGFDRLVRQLGTVEGPPIFRIFNLTLSDHAVVDWENILEEIGDERGQSEFEQAIDMYLNSKIDRDCAISTKEWLHQIKKPRSMTVKEFMHRIKQINNLFPYMPLPEEDDDEDARIQPFSDAELRNILKKASPRDWRVTQAKSNLRFTSTPAQVQYYEKLRNLTDRRVGPDRYHPKKHQPVQQDAPPNTNKPPFVPSKDSYDPDAPCPIHGTHTVGQCHIIQNARTKYKSKKSGTAHSNHGSAGDASTNASSNSSNSHRFKHKSRDRATTTENNGIDTSSHASGSDDEDNYAIEEELV